MIKTSRVNQDENAVDPECDLPDGRFRLYQERTRRVPYDWAAVNAQLQEAGVTGYETWPLSYAENVPMMVQISDDLHAAGYVTYRGGGFGDENGTVRELLAVRDRMRRIAGMHRKNIGPGGMTDGYCSECSWTWPCPTYDWARETSDRDPAVSAWNRNDEDEELDNYPAR